MNIPTAPVKNHTTGEFHPRSRHRSSYAFSELCAHSPTLARYIRPHPRSGGPAIDYNDPVAVKELNRALLLCHYGLTTWDLPEGFLCPPVPSRADYLHYAADLLASDGAALTLGARSALSVLDIGTGANCIFPLIGRSLYGWRFVGTDAHRTSLDWAQRLVDSNAGMPGPDIELRFQPSPDAVFRHVVTSSDRFALSVCNPPFYASEEEAERESITRIRPALDDTDTPHRRAFGGIGRELWCEGGEVVFIRRMIMESALFSENCVWFTTLVSRAGNLPAIEKSLATAGVHARRTHTMFAGQKQTRMLAWTFLPEEERRARLSPRLIGDRA